MTKNERERFNLAAQAYLDKFGGSLPIGISYPELSAELLEKAVKDEQAIEPNIPDQAIS